MAYKKDEQKEYVSLPWFGINKLLPYLKPYRRIIFCMIFLGLTGGLVDIVLPLFQRYALNQFIGKFYRSLHHGAGFSGGGQHEFGVSGVSD